MSYVSDEGSLKRMVFGTQVFSVLSARLIVLPFGRIMGLCLERRLLQKLLVTFLGVRLVNLGVGSEARCYYKRRKCLA